MGAPREASAWLLPLRKRNVSFLVTEGAWWKGHTSGRACLCRKPAHRGEAGVWVLLQTPLPSCESVCGFWPHLSLSLLVYKAGIINIALPFIGRPKRQAVTLITLRRRLGKTNEAPGRIINGSPQQPWAQHSPTAKERAATRPGGGGSSCKVGTRACFCLSVGQASLPIWASVSLLLRGRRRFKSFHLYHTCSL